MAEALELHAAGKTRVIHEKIHLNDIERAFYQVEKGEVPARLVIDMSLS